MLRNSFGHPVKIELIVFNSVMPHVLYLQIIGKDLIGNEIPLKIRIQKPYFVKIL